MVSCNSKHLDSNPQVKPILTLYLIGKLWSRLEVEGRRIRTHLNFHLISSRLCSKIKDSQLSWGNQLINQILHQIRITWAWVRQLSSLNTRKNSKNKWKIEVNRLLKCANPFKNKSWLKLESCTISLLMRPLTRHLIITEVKVKIMRLKTSLPVEMFNSRMLSRVDGRWVPFSHRKYTAVDK